MDVFPEWFQNFILALNGDEIFWIPIVSVFVGVFIIAYVPTLGKRFTKYAIIGSGLCAVVSALMWTHIADWRAEVYTAEAREYFSDASLVGADLSSEDIEADRYGVVSVNMELSYDVGFSEIFVISDVDDFIDYLTIQYITSDSSGDSYLEHMRNFQELHLDIVDAEDTSSSDTLSYHHDTLLGYAQNASLRNPDEPIFSESEDDLENEAQEAAEGSDSSELEFRVVSERGSPWEIRDERASEGGITQGQWSVIDYAPDALDSVNGVSCAVFNGFIECEEGEQQVYHSVLLVFAVMILGLIVFVFVEAMLNIFRERQNTISIRRQYKALHKERSAQKKTEN